MSTKSIINKISTKLKIKPEFATQIIQMFMSNIVTDCIKGEHVTIRGFGTFEMAHHKSKVVYTNGKMFETPERRVVKFRPGKMLHISVKLPPG